MGVNIYSGKVHAEKQQWKEILLGMGLLTI